MPPPSKLKQKYTALVCSADRFQKFHNHTRAKYWASAQTRGDPAQFEKWKAKPTWKESRLVNGVQFVQKIAVDAGIPSQELPNLGSTMLTVCKGTRRLMKANARLMVFRTMSQLHRCAPDDWHHLCDLIYIIGLGLPVVVGSTWLIAGGDPAKLAARNIAMHAPACLGKPCTFMLDKKFAGTLFGKELHCALWHCKQLPNSTWNVRFDKGQPLGENEVKAATISALATAILKLKVLDAGAGRGYALDMR